MLIEVLAPGNGKTYEFQLNGALPVERAKAMMAEAIMEAESGAIVLDAEQAVLGHFSRGQILPSGLSLLAAGVRSGDRLILV
jgi:hypothetical protein